MPNRALAANASAPSAAVGIAAADPCVRGDGPCSPPKPTSSAVSVSSRVDVPGPWRSAAPTDEGDTAGPFASDAGNRIGRRHVEEARVRFDGDPDAAVADYVAAVAG